MAATLHRDGAQYTLRLDRDLAHPPDRVWRALTERGLLAQWFPCDVIGDWTVGAKLRFVFPEGEADAELSGEVLAVDAPRLLEFRWGDSVLRCELVPRGDGCRLTFSESFEDASIAARNSAGWDLCLDNLLAVLLEQAPAAFSMAAWRVLFDRYAKRFEPVAGPQQGAPESHPDHASEADR